MGYTGDFFDNVTYGADDINAIRKSIATAGVLLVSGNECQVVANGSGNVKILPGEAVFEDGSRIEVDSDGVSLPLSGSGTNYVYFERDTINNTAQPKVSTTQPASNCICLAQVSGSTITDVRDSAMLKPLPTLKPYITGVEKITEDGVFVAPFAGTYKVYVIGAGEMSPANKVNPSRGGGAGGTAVGTVTLQKLQGVKVSFDGAYNPMGAPYGRVQFGEGDIKICAYNGRDSEGGGYEFGSAVTQTQGFNGGDGQAATATTGGNGGSITVPAELTPYLVAGNKAGENFGQAGTGLYHLGPRSDTSAYIHMDSSDANGYGAGGGGQDEYSSTTDKRGSGGPGLVMVLPQSILE